MEITPFLSGLLSKNMRGRKMNEAAIREKFKKEQNSRRKLLESAGVDSEQTEMILSAFEDEIRNDRIFYRHNEQYPEDIYADAWDKNMADVTDAFINEDVKFWWLDEIDDVRLHKKLKKCTDEELEIINALAFEGCTEEELASKMLLSQSAVSKKLNKIRGKIDISGIRS